MDIGISREQTKVGKVMYGKEGWREQKEVDKGDGPGGGLLTRSLHPGLHGLLAASRPGLHLC